MKKKELVYYCPLTTGRAYPCTKNYCAWYVEGLNRGCAVKLLAQAGLDNLFVLVKQGARLK